MYWTYVSSVEGLDAMVVSGCESSIVDMEPRNKTRYAYANLICLNASCSSLITHSCHSEEPYCMHPKMTLETFNPEVPRRTLRRYGRMSLQKMALNLYMDLPYETFLMLADMVDDVGLGKGMRWTILYCHGRKHLHSFKYSTYLELPSRLVYFTTPYAVVC